MTTQEPLPDPSAWRGARALVLGASGFLGRWVARLLARAGADLHVAVRDLERGTRVLGAWDARGNMHEVDLATPGSLEDLLERVEPAVVFDLAGYGVGRDERDEAAAVRVNQRLPERLAASFRRGRHPAWRGLEVVRAGSALEYGEASGDLSERTPPRPTTLYGRTKLEGTLALARRCQASGLRGITARLFTVFGPGERAGRLFPSIVAAARSGSSVALSLGAQRRDFVCAEDAAEGLLRLARSAAIPGEVVNLASGRLTSVRDFALATARSLGIPEERLRFGDLPVSADEMQHDPVDVARLRELCRWSPAPAVPAGIDRALAWPDLLSVGAGGRSA